MGPLDRSVAIARNDFEMLRQDPTAPIILIVMPLVVMAFIKPAVAPILRQEGWPGANGAEQAVPGMALFFAFYIVAFAGVAFFREFIWSTWDRLRALPIKRWEILLGKIAPTFLILCMQQLLLFTAGYLLFKLNSSSVAGVAVIDFSFIVFMTTFILVAVAICRTFQQLLAVANLGAILFAALGGALTPMRSLPSWAADLSPITPTYWAMKGFSRVLLNRDGVHAVLLPAGILLAASLVLGMITSMSFRFNVAKSGTL
jgi:ABC-2 type transport system permease protein